ncbi:MAG TPA: prephenate dehydratase [Armatimonadetes bacterium]|nr:prephenate dehydratase [Armatimonadota bacterium]
MDIHELREEIDHIDRQILDLLNKRARCAKEIGVFKQRTKKTFFAPEREKQVLARLTDANKGPLSDASIRAIYREIISAARALEDPMTIAYWGPPATNTHMASIRKFGSSCNFSAMDTIPDVFNEVEKERAQYGVVPIENSTEGVINHTLDTFLTSKLKICSEIYLPITHNLLSMAEDTGEVKRVYSIPTAAAQCRIWLRTNMPGVEIIDVSTTARGAQICAEEPHSAAIGTALAKEEYGLNLLAEHIEDNPQNRTRFLVVGANEPGPSWKDKTSVMFSVHHKAGTLFKAMSVFDKYDINLTMIESRPTKLTPWEYVFFLDFQGHVKDTPVQKALAALSEYTLFINVLGSYPEAE